MNKKTKYQAPSFYVALCETMGLNSVKLPPGTINVAVFNMDNDGTEQVTIPLDKDFADFDERMAEAIKKLGLVDADEPGYLHDRGCLIARLALDLIGTSRDIEDRAMEMFGAIEAAAELPDALFACVEYIFECTECGLWRSKSERSKVIGAKGLYVCEICAAKRREELDLPDMPTEPSIVHLANFGCVIGVIEEVDRFGMKFLRIWMPEKGEGHYIDYAPSAIVSIEGKTN